jgi:transcriptional regulator with XRE-family HTH domain
VKLAERVRAERVRAGLSQRKLAQAADLKQPSLSRIENGKCVASLETISRIAAALGLDTADLLMTGPSLLEVEFSAELEHRPPSPWLERRLLDHVPESARPFTAAWPHRGDGVLRLRTRASCVPMMATMAGAEIPGLARLPPPTIRPVCAARDLSVLVVADVEGEARRAVRERLQGRRVQRVDLLKIGRLWSACVRGVSAANSLALQGLCAESPFLLFVPA